MNEKKTKRPLILSMPVIILISVITLTILAPVSVIMSLIRFKKYPELKNKNIICLCVSGVMLIALILFCAIGSDTNSEPAAVAQEVSMTEEPETIEEAVTEEPEPEASTEAAETEAEETGLYGYPEQEKELTDAGIDISNIPSRECFLYTYAEYKALADHMDLKDKDAIETEVWNYVSDTTGMTDYEMIDAIVYGYAGDNLANYIPDYLVPLVGDECNDVVDSAMAIYYGYTEDGSETSTDNAVTIEYIEALEETDAHYIAVSNHGSKTKEEIYAAASDVASNISSIQFNNYSKDFIRDLDNNVGKPIVYSGTVSSIGDKYIEVAYAPEYYGEGEASAVKIDPSCLNDNTILQQDKVTVYGVYLGLNSSNYAVILALSVTIN